MILSLNFLKYLLKSNLKRSFLPIKKIKNYEIKNSPIRSKDSKSFGS